MAYRPRRAQIQHQHRVLRDIIRILTDINLLIANRQMLLRWDLLTDLEAVATNILLHWDRLNQMQEQGLQITDYPTPEP